MPLKNIKQIEHRHLLTTYNRYDLLVDRGSGPYLIDRSNRRYLDLIAGLGVNALGYAHPRIVRVLRKQVKRPLHVSNLFYHEFAGPLAARLADLSGLDRVFFTNSGTESVEGALKFARLYGGEKHRFLALEGAFHGRTMGALSATHAPKYREPFEPLLAGFEFVKFNDTADLERHLDDDVTAVLIETVQGEGGVRLVSGEFYSAARQLTREHGALLIADEVQCGLGRTGRWLAVHKFADPRSRDLLPDLVTLAKPLGGGLPMGAVLLADHVAEKVQPGMHGHTFAGGPLACRVSLELLRTIEGEGLLDHAREIGAYFLDRLREFKEHALVRDVRGDGLMLALELSVPSRPVVMKLLEAGYITNSTSETVLRLLPPLIIRKKQVDKFLPALKTALDAVGPTS